MVKNQMFINIFLGILIVFGILISLIYIPTEHLGNPIGQSADQKQSDREHARAIVLEHDLATTHEQLMRAESDQVAAETARRSLETTHANDEASLAQERRVSTDLANRLTAAVGRLASAEREAATRTQASMQSLDAERARSAAFERDLAVARAQLSRRDVADNDIGRASAITQAGHEADRPDRQVISADRGPLQPEPRPAPNRDVVASPLQSALQKDGAGLSDVLPDGIPARVVMYYSRDNQAARTHAVALKSTLQTQGLDVSEMISRSQNNTPTSIVYYYDDDRVSAEKIAKIVGSVKPIKNKLSKTGSVRPGRVDVTVGS